MLVAGTIIGLGLAGASPIVMMGVVAVVILGVNLIMLAIAWRDTGGTTTRRRSTRATRSPAATVLTARKWSDS